MSYLDDLAAEISNGVPDEVRPDADTRDLFRLYAVLALAKGEAVDARDVHNALAAWMLQHDPEHRSIQPFEQLDDRTQASDEPFVRAIHAAVARRAGSPIPSAA